MTTNTEKPLVHILLFCNIFVILFVVPCFPKVWHPQLYDVFLTIVIFLSALSLDRSRALFLGFAASFVLVEFFGRLLNLPLLTRSVQYASILFFTYIVINLIIQVARTKRVTLKVILESINGYLLLGLAFAIIIYSIIVINQNTFTSSDINMPANGEFKQLSHVIYFSLVTLTTLGYGDMTPKSSAGMSLATLIAVTGQIYVAVIIAMLVGKFSSQTDDVRREMSDVKRKT